MNARPPSSTPHRPPRRGATAGDTVFALGLAAFMLAAAGGLLVATGGVPRLAAYLSGGGTPTPGASGAGAATSGPATPSAVTSPRPLASPAAPTATPAASPDAAASPTPRPARSYAMNLYRPGVFVHQVNKDTCLAAAVQNMLNVIRSVEERRKPDVTAATQRALYARTVKLTTKQDSHNGGTGPGGWAAILTQEGYPYEVRAYDSRNEAIQAAAAALRATGRPVGILAWQGVHSWVMTGFAATADPTATTKFTVTTAYILDPWYPWVSTRWPRSQKPNAPHDAADLRANVLPWKLGSGPYPGRDGKFLIVAPLGG